MGYDAQVNLYAYVANDPISHVDPTGTYLDDFVKKSALDQKAMHKSGAAVQIIGPNLRSTLYRIDRQARLYVEEGDRSQLVPSTLRSLDIEVDPEN